MKDERETESERERDRERKTEREKQREGKQITERKGHEFLSQATLLMTSLAIIPDLPTKNQRLRNDENINMQKYIQELCSAF